MSLLSDSITVSVNVTEIATKLTTLSTFLNKKPFLKRNYYSFTQNLHRKKVSHFLNDIVLQITLIINPSNKTHYPHPIRCQKECQKYPGLPLPGCSRASSRWNSHSSSSCFPSTSAGMKLDWTEELVFHGKTQHSIKQQPVLGALLSLLHSEPAIYNSLIYIYIYAIYIYISI